MPSEQNAGKLNSFLNFSWDEINTCLCTHNVLVIFSDYRAEEKFDVVSISLSRLFHFHSNFDFL